MAELQDLIDEFAKTLPEQTVNRLRDMMIGAERLKRDNDELLEKHENVKRQYDVLMKKHEDESIKLREYQSREMDLKQREEAITRMEVENKLREGFLEKYREVVMLMTRNIDLRRDVFTSKNMEVSPGGYTQPVSDTSSVTEKQE